MRFRLDYVLVYTDRTVRGTGLVALYICMSRVPTPEAEPAARGGGRGARVIGGAAAGGGAEEGLDARGTGTERESAGPATAPRAGRARGIDPATVASKSYSS